MIHVLINISSKLIFLLQYASSLSYFAQFANKITRDLDPANELGFVRLTCTKYEVLMATFDFATVVVLQRPNKKKLEDNEERDITDFGHCFPDQHGGFIKEIITDRA